MLDSLAARHVDQAISAIADGGSSPPRTQPPVRSRQGVDTEKRKAKHRRFNAKRQAKVRKITEDLEATTSELKATREELEALRAENKKLRDELGQRSLGAEMGIPRHVYRQEPLVSQPHPPAIRMRCGPLPAGFTDFYNYVRKSYRDNKEDWGKIHDDQGNGSRQTHLKLTNSAFPCPEGPTLELSTCHLNLVLQLIKLMFEAVSISTKALNYTGVSILASDSFCKTP